MNISYVTEGGYEKLKKELDYLIKVRRREIAQKIATAREHGDLRENAEYDAAKEEQGFNELKIQKLSQKLATARVLDEKEIPHDKVYLGATVRLLNLKDQEEIEYTLVSEVEADIMENKISVTSPLGKGLLGHCENDEVAIEVPAGLMKYKILKITRG